MDVRIKKNCFSCQMFKINFSKFGFGGDFRDSVSELSSMVQDNISQWAFKHMSSGESLRGWGWVKTSPFFQTLSSHDSRTDFHRAHVKIVLNCDVIVCPYIEYRLSNGIHKLSLSTQAVSIVMIVGLYSLMTDTEGEDVSLTRRSSSGGLMSPEVLGTTTEHDGFYLLKKDSQRRTTLFSVLNKDQAKICESWLRAIRQDKGDCVLNMHHIELLMCGLKEYIANQNKEQLEAAMHSLKEDLEFDSVAINQLHLAIYLFQDAVSLFSQNLNLFYKI